MTIKHYTCALALLALGCAAQVGPRQDAVWLDLSQPASIEGLAEGAEAPEDNLVFFAPKGTALPVDLSVKGDVLEGQARAEVRLQRDAWVYFSGEEGILVSFDRVDWVPFHEALGGALSIGTGLSKAGPQIQVALTHALR